MNAKRGILAFFLIMVLGIFFMFGASAVQAADIDLAYANFFPPTHIQAKLGASWAKEIEKRTNGKGIELVWIEAGDFWMGSPTGDPWRDDDETHVPNRQAAGDAGHLHGVEGGNSRGER